MKYNIIFRKAIKGYLLLGSIILLGNSCVKDNLLDRNDPTGVDDGKAWTTPYLTKLGMNGVYAALKMPANTKDGAGTTDRELYQYDQYGTSQTYSNQGRREIIWGGASSSTPVFSDTWKDLFEGVVRACDALENIPKKSQAKEEDKASYIAEAKFLRAYFYVKLNQLWRGVPIYDSPITIHDNMRPRSTEREVWDFIIKDLTDCINEPNLVQKYNKGSKEYGRATKGAAYALRGKVYLYLKMYGEAIKDFDEVKQCGYSLFQGSYKDLFKEANEQCEEMIFSIQNIAVQGYGATQHQHCGTRSAFGGGWNSYGVAPRTVDLYDNLDGSEFNWNDIIPGYLAMAVKDREVYFLRDTHDLRNKLIDQGLTDDKKLDAAVSAIKSKVEARLKTFSSDAVRALYLPDGNEARVRPAYLNRDPRLEQSVITPYASFFGALGNNDNLVIMRWPYHSDEVGVGDLKSDDTGDLYYFHRKFVGEGTAEVLLRSASPIDQPILRYADVVLMKAEALVGLDKLDDAVACINEVRGRVGVGLLNSSAETTVSSKAEVLERLVKERKVELLNEGHSYFDALRWGTWEEFFKKDEYGTPAGRQWVYGNVKRAYVYDGAKTLIWPIPAADVEKNPALLPNNPGW